MHVKLVLAPSNSLLTVPRRQFCRGSLLSVFGVTCSATFHRTCVHIYFSSVSADDWPPFGKSLLIRLTIWFSFVFVNSVITVLILRT